MPKNRNNSRRHRSALWLKPLILSAGGGLAAMAALMGFFAFLMVQCMLSARLFYAFSTAAICLGCFCSGNIAAHLQKGNGLWCGFCSFCSYTAVLAVANLLAGCRSVDGHTLLRLCLLLASGAAGGYSGLRSAEKQTKRRHTGH